MVEVLRRLGDSPTRADLDSAVFSIRGFDLGIGEPVSFSQEQRQGLQQVYFTVAEDGRFVSLQDWQARFS